jgi:UDP-glucose 4-epimerase
MTPPTRFAVCGAGFIGSNLIERLIAEGGTVSVLDHKPAPPSTDPRLTWVQGDFSSPADLRVALAGVDVAYHLVSTTVPGDDHVGLLQELSDNISATMRFLDVCAEQGVRRIVFASSSSVYGLQRTTPIPESAETTPISSHGIHKLTIEKYLLLHHFNTDADIRILRLSNPYGPGQSLMGRQGFVAIAIGKLLAGQPVLLRGEGSPIRDFVYISDVCDAMVAAAVAEKVPPVVNIGTGVGHSLAVILAEIEDLTDREFAMLDTPLRKADIPESVLDIRLAHRALGFSPRVGIREGLARTLAHHGVALPD